MRWNTCDESYCDELYTEKGTHNQINILDEACKEIFNDQSPLFGEYQSNPLIVQENDKGATNYSQLSLSQLKWDPNFMGIPCDETYRIVKDLEIDGTSALKNCNVSSGFHNNGDWITHIQELKKEFTQIVACLSDKIVNCETRITLLVAANQELNNKLVILIEKRKFLILLV
jgi:hypothetical protein